jgi:hypothetical protein
MGVTIADDEMQNLGLGSARTSFWVVRDLYHATVAVSRGFMFFFLSASIQSPLYDTQGM